MNVISSDKLIYPLFSDEVDTFILPILNNKNLLRQPIKLAEGWRYFEDIVVLQKKKDKINEKNLSKYLQTNDIPDPDILIRTGNTQRLSNFLLWQLAYSEIFFEKKLWPEFNENDYNRIIKNYKKIKRNFGNI